MMFPLIADKDLLNRQSLPSSMVKRVDGHAQSIGPLREGSSFAVKLNHEIERFFAAIVSLLYSCCPAAVARLVVTIVVNSIDTQAFLLRLPHVFKKSKKRFLPAIAHLYSSPAVSLKSGCAWLVASFLHCLPRMKSWRSPKVPDCCAASVYVTNKTPAASAARSLNFVSELVRRAVADAAAVAKALPGNLVFRCSASKSNYKKTLKPLRGKVQNPMVESRRMRRLAIINSSHEMFLGIKGCLWLVVGRCYSTCQSRLIIPFLAGGSNG